MSVGRPLPGDVVEDAIDQPFWDACNDGVLLVYRCNICATSYWPAGSCTAHGMRDIEWVPAAGTGHLHTWTVVHQKYSKSFTDKPTVVAVVKLDEGPLLHTNLIDAEGTDLRVGMPVEVVFETVEEGAVLPVFRPRP
ncbi:Zn-ribbon domain-containing OB-fold protein [Nocardia sp. 348MFTsu5.1]|uniref:Zn-ribbon domain-containing OB-fold protein n=1 Tax=Nocardia sp. 348MFTsu5.1 TaxID=1172185 RepID=UPI0003677C52|nr:OB-fold domain-containing protein [Nocardia sp. 348MFTsu5.1]